MFHIPWIQLYWPTAPIAVGSNVAVCIQFLGGYWLNASRIVYLVENTASLVRFGFAYGTLSKHAESGEERFLIDWDRETDVVSYDLLAFSRPNQLLVKLGYPLARRLQKRFAVESKAAMVKAVRS
jgi:uncharacterized protein (UPF0548 family)